MLEYIFIATTTKQSDKVKFLSSSQCPFLGVAYTVDSLVCILTDFSLNVYKHVYIPVEMGILFGGVFSEFIFYHCNHM